MEPTITIWVLTQQKYLDLRQYGAARHILYQVKLGKVNPIVYTHEKSNIHFGFQALQLPVYQGKSF